jgi:hypothetical protein
MLDAPLTLVVTCCARSSVRVSLGCKNEEFAKYTLYSFLEFLILAQLYEFSPFGICRTIWWRYNLLQSERKRYKYVIVAILQKLLLRLFIQGFVQFIRRLFDRRENNTLEDRGNDYKTKYFD